MTKKLWGGRFTGKTDPLMEAFNASIDFDQRLWQVDIQGSQAYARALLGAGLLTAAEAESLVAGLQQVAQEWAQGEFVIRAGDEDIHTANERRLTELVGAVAGKLHTGRSRNDQIATDVRLWLRQEIVHLRQHTDQLIGAALERAAEEIDLLMPGYTHLQPAQPVRWSHWLLSHVWAWQRDADRLDELAVRVNIMPLGSGALAGNPFAIDRAQLAAALGFADITYNSMDGVSDRDFIVEFLFWATLAMVHLSRFAEDLIVYSSREFGFVTLADAYSTGSSLMPQKKNPDALELLRGKSGRMVGHLTGLVVTIKGLPSTYNKDLQEDKEPLFDAVTNISGSLQIACGVLSTLQVNPVAMRAALIPEMLATDLAEYLVRKGVPFRESHHVAGAAVQMAELQGISLSQLEVEDLQKLHSAFEADASAIWNFDESVERRDVDGGTSRRAVLAQIAHLRAWLAGRHG
ncbi:argininosuccinate lyase [Caldilinea sp.]|uniref:argininosuccinate lyase n=1 Tax=Caldilinea sp. TaxID=2293560 RepID=UPI002B98FE8C|nr:argininosuccinate lyase [Caldilinea sp.]HRA66407.1 argininosuccinate lyase [Caldilinea sp.]